jgi:phosphomannomutase
LDFKQTLTGFKWISKLPNLVFGYEEALGYCIDPNQVSDKDGISAALLISNIARSEAMAGRTLWDLLADLGERYGYYATGQISIRVTDLSVISKAMKTLRMNPPTEIANTKLLFTDMAITSELLPATDGLMFELADDRRVIIRPSGTEPKLKCYLQAVGKTSLEADALLAELTESCRELLADFN